MTIDDAELDAMEANLPPDWQKGGVLAVGYRHVHALISELRRLRAVLEIIFECESACPHCSAVARAAYYEAP
jgi:hypothetical protein